MESDQLSQDHLFSSVYDQITISAEPSNDEKSIDEFESKLNLLTCDIIQNKVVAGLTLLQHAAKEGLPDYAKSIIDSHIDPNVVCNENGKSALAIAAEFGQWKVIEIFIKYNKQFSSQSHRQSFDSSDLLSEVPVNFKVKTTNKETILHILLKRPKLFDLVDGARNRGVDSSTDKIRSLKQQWKELNRGYLRCIRGILWNEACSYLDSNFINLQDQLGNTALHYATCSWPKSVVTRLLELGASPTTQNDHGESPLQSMQSEYFESFLDDFCIEADKFDDSDVDDDTDDISPDFAYEYDPNFMTNIRQSPITFNYQFLSPYNSESTVFYPDACQMNDEEGRVLRPVVYPEMNVLTEISKSKEHRHILTHPVVKSYIWMKWKLINQFFHRDIRLRLNLVFCLTWYIFYNFGGHDYNQKCLFEPSVNLTVFCWNVHSIPIWENTPRPPVAATQEIHSSKTLTNFTKLDVPPLEEIRPEIARQSFQIPHNTRFCKDEKFAFNYPENTHENLHHGCSYASTWYIAFVFHAIIQVYLIYRGGRKTLRKRLDKKYSRSTTMTQSTVTLIILFWADLVNIALLILVLWKSEIILWLIVGVLLFTHTLNELNQFASTRLKYLTKPGNYIDMMEAIFVGILLLVPNSYLIDPMTFSSIDVTRKLCEIQGLDIDEESNCSVKRGMAAVLIVLTWTRLLHSLAKHPSLEKFNVYFMMFYQVSRTFLKILMWYVLCIISFGLGFYIMLHNDIGDAKLKVENSLLTYKFFDSPWTSLFRAFIMFVGEIDFNNIPIGISYGMRHGNISTIFAYLFLLAFIFLISVVLVNLLNGLAVSDTGEIMRESVILHEVSRIDTISYFETITLSNLKWIDGTGRIFPFVDGILQRYISCLHKGIFIFHTHISPSNPKLTLPLHPLQPSPKTKTIASGRCVWSTIRQSRIKCKEYSCQNIVHEAKEILIRHKLDKFKEKMRQNTKISDVNE